MSNREVRGPRSALTSFLQEKGIRARNITYQRRNANATAGQQDEAANAADPPVTQDEDAPPTPPDTTENTPASSVRKPVKKRKKDEDEDLELEEGEQAAQETKDAEVSKKASSSKSPPAKSKKKPKKGPDDDDEEWSRFLTTNPTNPTAPNPYSIVAFCTRCRRRFARSAFARMAKAASKSNPVEVEELCPACTTAGAKSGGGGGTAKKGRRKKDVKGDDDGGEGRVGTLRGMCIKLVCDHIDSVTEFGDIPTPVKHRIATILSRQRTLDSTNVRLFLSPDDERVVLSDCTRVDEIGLGMIPGLAWKVKELELGFCGRLTDTVVEAICEKCPFIESISLQGSFLVTDKGFSKIFETYGKQLRKIVIEDSPKLTTKSIHALVDSCSPSSTVTGPSPTPPTHTGLVHLRLARCASLTDQSLLALVGLGCSLERLEISGLADNGVTDAGVVAVLEALGGNLTGVDVSANRALGDATALAVKDFCPRVRQVNVNGCLALTNNGVVEMLEGIRAAGSGENGDAPRGLTKIDVGRLPVGVVDDKVVDAVVEGSGGTAREVNVNGADAITRDALDRLVRSLSHLHTLDLSWVRATDDEALETLVESASEVREVRVFGCNRVTEVAARRRWRNKEGEVLKVIGSEFE